MDFLKKITQFFEIESPYSMVKEALDEGMFSHEISFSRLGLRSSEIKFQITIFVNAQTRLSYTLFMERGERYSRKSKEIGKLKLSGNGNGIDWDSYNTPKLRNLIMSKFVTEAGFFIESPQVKRNLHPVTAHVLDFKRAPNQVEDNILRVDFVNKRRMS